MEDAVLTGHLKLIEVTFLYRLVKGEDDLAFLRRCSDDLWRECHLMMIDKTVEADTDTFCDFLLAQGMDIYGLTQIIDDCQFCSRVSLGDDALGLTKLCPATVHRFCLRCDRSGEARLLTTVVVGQLYDDERHLLVVPEVAPATYHLL